ncbi:MAG: cupredoxin domain-containing protein [Actinomycetota bacterium]
MRERRLIAVPVIVGLTLLVAACGGGDSESSTPEPESGDLAPGSAAISMVDLAFEPTVVTVAPGSTEIALTNADSTDHTFTLDDGSVDVAIAAGEKTTATVDLTESVGFHCSIHSSMTGTLQVA